MAEQPIPIYARKHKNSPWVRLGLLLSLSTELRRERLWSGGPLGLVDGPYVTMKLRQKKGFNKALSTAIGNDLASIYFRLDCTPLGSVSFEALPIRSRFGRINAEVEARVVGQIRDINP